MAFRAQLRILPAALLGLLPFTLFDRAWLEAQYSLRGQRAPNPELKVITYSKPAEIAAAWKAASDGGALRCLIFTSDLRLSPSPPPPCRVFSFAGRFTLREMEELRPEMAQATGLSPTPIPPEAETLFYGPRSVFQALSTESAMANHSYFYGGRWLVFVPAPSEIVTDRSSPIATPIGPLSPVEVGLNILADTVDGQALKKTPRLAQLTLSVASVVLVAWVLYAYPIVLTALFALTWASVLFVASMISFDKLGLQLSIVAPLVAMVTAYFLGISEQLDRRERAAWSLEREADNLQRLDEMRSNFLSLVSHDLRTPIARIQSVLERFQRGDFGPLNSPQTEQLGKLVSASGHLQQSISTLLLLSRIESGQIELKLEPTDLSALLETVVRQHLGAAAERSIRLEAQFEPLFLVDIDQGLLREVANNLIDNALKYSPAGSQLWVRCGEQDNCTELSPPQPGIWFEVQDQGPGIPPEDRERVLEKFQRGLREAAVAGQASTGSGLGLYLSSFFVAKHGGQLTLISQVKGERSPAGTPASQYFSADESGTVVRVVLPVETPDETNA